MNRRQAKIILFLRAEFKKEYPFCIICTANPNVRYPTICFEGRVRLAHRFSYEIYKGSIPVGFEVDHLCQNIRCINPGHLESVDPITNYERAMRRPGGWHRGEQNGGHKLTEEEVKEIKYLLRNTALSQKEIGQKFGVTNSAISLIHNKKNWSHVK